MTEPLRVKGVIFEAVIAALQPNLHRIRPQIAGRLHHYLDQPVLASSWYPFQDYSELLGVLASTVDRTRVPGDPYEFFGRMAAQRDIGGSQEKVPRKQRATTSGVYRSSVMAGQGVAGQIRRVLAVRKQYFSVSNYTVQRTGERTLRLCLVDFPVISRNICASVTGFLDEAFSMLRLGKVSLLACKAQGASDCAWELRLDQTVDVSELVAFE